MDGPLLRLESSGHPAVRATHRKTLEFTADTAITERATCVVGVGSRATPAVAVAGPVRLTITAGTVTAVVEAIANPDWRPGGGAVVRVGSDRRPDTFATDADLSSADLPRELVALATDPATRIEVRCDRLPRRPDGRAGLVLAWAQPAGPPAGWLAAEVAAADAVVADDAGAMHVLAALGAPALAPAAAERGLLDGALGRVLVIATVELPGVGLAGALGRPDAVAVEVRGLPPAVGAAVASPFRGPVELAGAVPRARIDAVLRSAPAGTGLALTVAVADLARLLELAAQRRGVRTGVLLDPAAGGPATWGELAAMRVDRTSGSVACFLDGAEPAAGIDEPLAGFAQALLADGVSARSVALALAQLPGWSRRRGYDAVHELRGPSGAEDA